VILTTSTFVLEASRGEGILLHTCPYTFLILPQSSCLYHFLTKESHTDRLWVLAMAFRKRGLLV
jgi:hypothetical protein